jgi:beta-N-acetylhexosaminidase
VLGADAAVVSEKTAPPSPEGRPLVIVVRDAHRHTWERRTVERLLAESPDAVVVEVGLPLWRPDGASWLATHGGGRANFEAAAAVLSPDAVAV